MRIAFVLVSFLATAGALRADQAVYTTRELADRAAAEVKVGDEVRDYCSPCSDKGYVSFTVETVEVKPIGNEGDFNLALNGEEKDLAYVYVKKDGKWSNLGLLVKADVQSVPEILPDDVPPLDAPASAK